jgi:CheY-like chemotaxis protein
VYDLIFLDVEMPKMDGYELCDRIRRISSQQDTPIVFVTSSSGEDALEMARASGGSDFITKPFVPVELSLKALILVMSVKLSRC